MIRIPGPSQVSRARASSVGDRRTLSGVASGVRSRSLTTMTRRPRGTSMRVAPGSGEKVVGPVRRVPCVEAVPASGCVFAVTALPS